MPRTRLPFGLSKNMASAIILGVAILLFMVLKATKPDAQVNPPKEPVFTVRTVTVTPSDRHPSLILYGTAVSPSQARLTAAVSADVKSVSALAGDDVALGEPLIELDPAEAEIAVSQAQAQLYQAEAVLSLDIQQKKNDKLALSHEQQLLSLAERSVARAVDLRNKGLLSEADLDATKQKLQQQKIQLDQRRLVVAQANANTQQKQAQMSSAEAQLRRAELDLNRTQIMAPFNAVVVATHVAPGDRVAPGQSLVDIYQRDNIEIRAQVPNRHLAAFSDARQNHEAITAYAIYRGQRIAANFLRLAPSGGGGGQNAYFSLASSDLGVDTSLSLEITLPAQANAVAIPFNALYD
ncbi:MAG: efflux RND transporter periplasmic adaptor subunit, partial [Oceanococcus sp.]